MTPDKLRQILMNLIENAVKYSPDGGRIEVGLEARDSRVRVIVRDEGIGIPPGEEQRIFGKFYRVDPQLSRGVGGTGLGLYISRELVRRMAASRSPRTRARARRSSSTCRWRRRRAQRDRLDNRPVAAPIRIGTCSWADESLTRYFYPPGVKGAEERLRYYADRFDTVEANSTYYRLPDEEMVRRWHERTPDGFIMHVKAFGVMTRHPVKLEQLPPDLREGAPVDERGRIDRPPREFRAEGFPPLPAALEPCA